VTEAIQDFWRDNDVRIGSGVDLDPNTPQTPEGVVWVDVIHPAPDTPSTS
jgi:hypothetical protein